LRIAVLIPCYNEACTIGKVVSDFKALDASLPIFVYDNNSTDDTAQIAADAGAIVVPEYRQGKGHVLRSMFRDIDADCYVMVDGDDTYPADEALALCELVRDGRADMVVGDRLSSTYFSENSRPLHGIGNRLVRWLVNRIFGSELRDIMSGSRAFSRRFVKSFPVATAGFEIETEMTIHALDKAFLIREVPIGYRDRPEGSCSKLSTFGDGTKVLRTIAALFKDYRPLAFFGIASALLMTAALVMFIVPLDEYLATGYVRKVPTLIVSIGLGMGSLLSLVCAVVLDSLRKQSKQFYELVLTMQAESDAREAARRAAE
jgi:glycosyltransferase involved in cell wall biosynthesis